MANGLESKARFRRVSTLSGCDGRGIEGFPRHLRPKDEKISLRTIKVLTFTVTTTDPNEVVQP